MYVVIFANYSFDAENKIPAARHKFKTLKAAREYASDFWNAYIFNVDNNGDFSRCKTRSEIRRNKKG